jgi:hypothetical protein
MAVKPENSIACNIYIRVIGGFNIYIAVYRFLAQNLGDTLATEAKNEHCLQYIY